MLRRRRAVDDGLAVGELEQLLGAGDPDAADAGADPNTANAGAVDPRRPDIAEKMPGGSAGLRSQGNPGAVPEADPAADAEPEPAAGVGDPDFTGPIVQLADITRIFPGSPPVQALRGVDLAVDRGDYLAIVGSSGSGKSTMLNTIGLIDRPSSGSYLFEGIDTAGLGEDDRAALRGGAIGFVFQSFHLMATRTVLDNVMLATAYAGVPREEREERARAALDRVGLAHRVGFFPGTLSGGERQRVAIARAVSTGPRLLLADEPTGNLDRVNSETVMRLFDELGAEGLTIVMITHDAAVAEAARRRVRIQDGLLTEES